LRVLSIINWDETIAPSRKDFRRSESVRPAKLNTRSAVALVAAIARN
jgi:hypothetical protein